jgi:hypothetical protein
MDNDKTSLKQIRTFQGDVTEALQSGQHSLVSIQRAEETKQNATQSTTNQSQDSNKSRLEVFYLSLGSLLLVTLGILGAWYGYTQFTTRPATTIRTTPANQFIPIDSEVRVDLSSLSRESLIQSITESLRDTAEKEMKQIVFAKTGFEDTKNPFPIDEFLKQLGVQAPGYLVRAFDPYFMLGAYGQSHFFIIKLSSFENTFAGMLAWEKDLNQDIGSLLTTRELSEKILPGTQFTDTIDKNKDVRMLALNNEPVMVYTFLNNNLLIITDHLETLRVLINRLTRERLLR